MITKDTSAKFMKGDRLAFPNNIYPAWCQRMIGKVHAIGPRGLVHVRFLFDGYDQYRTFSARELAGVRIMRDEPAEAPAATEATEPTETEMFVGVLDTVTRSDARPSLADLIRAV